MIEFKPPIRPLNIQMSVIINGSMAEMTMKQSKDPFEAAFGDQQSPPDSPIDPDETETQTPAAELTVNGQGDHDANTSINSVYPSTSATTSNTRGTVTATKNKEEDDDDEDENMEVELGKFSSTGDPDKMAKMQAILSQFTEEQMSRYESFRRSGFQKANMKRLLASITGSAKISIPMTIVVSGIAKIFVGELVETARTVMIERKESGPIRPCHIRESYRRLKLENK
ncbi:hypothetical protein RJ640_010448, partial [Escallonia rubra]